MGTERLEETDVVADCKKCFPDTSGRNKDMHKLKSDKITSFRHEVSLNWLLLGVRE